MPLILQCLCRPLQCTLFFSSSSSIISPRRLGRVWSRSLSHATAPSFSKVPSPSGTYFLRFTTHQPTLESTSCPVCLHIIFHFINLSSCPGVELFSPLVLVSCFATNFSFFLCFAVDKTTEKEMKIGFLFLFLCNTLCFVYI